MSWTWDDEKTEKLINLISQRSALWDGTHSQCKNSNFLGKQWEDVARHMGLVDKKEGKDKCRNKWRALVSKYGIEKAKVQNLRSGAGADEIIESSWAHYNSMHFLKDACAKKSSGNIDELRGAVKKDEAVKASTSQSLGDVPTSMIKAENPSMQNCASNSIKYDNSATEISLDFEEAEWNHFLSFMPFLNEITVPTHKLKFRMEAQFHLLKLVDEEEKLAEHTEKIKKEIEEEIQEKKEVQKVKNEGKVKKDTQFKKMNEVQEEEYVEVSDDEDGITVLAEVPSSSKKMKRGPTTQKVVVKKEIEESDEFKNYVTNHFYVEK